MKFIPLAFDAGAQLNGIMIKMLLPKRYEEELRKLFSKMQSGAVLELTTEKQKRSLNANAYMWVLCNEIANVIHSTKEDVYRDAVKAVGVFETLSCTGPEQFQRFCEKWQSNGLGWIVEMVDEQLLVFNAYYGSSRYDKEEMNVLVNYVVDAAKELGIETKDQEEINSLIREWEYGSR